MKKRILIPLLVICLLGCTDNGDSSTSQVLSSNSNDIVSLEISSEEEKSSPIFISNVDESLFSVNDSELSSFELINSNKYNVGSDDISNIVFNSIIIH